MSIKFTDKLPAPTSRTMKDSGELVAPCTFARSGVMQYLAKELSPLFDDLPPTTIVRVMRTVDELYKPAVMEGLKSAPITIGHPTEDVCVANYKTLAKGVLSGMPIQDEDSTGEKTLAGELVLNDQEAIDLTDPANPLGKSGLSLGYTADLIRVSDCATHDAEQVNIRPNHIAIVPIGRAGSEFRIGDSDEVLAELEKVEAAKVEAEAAKAIEEQAAADAQKAANDAAALLAQVPADDVSVKLADALTKLDVLQAKLDVANEALASKKDLRFSDEDIIGMVNKKVAFLILAKQFSDKDYSAVSEEDAKREIVAARFGDMSGRSVDYIGARFEMMMEDETPSDMSRLLQEQANLGFKDAQVKPSVAEEARLRMMERHTHRHDPK